MIRYCVVILYEKRTMNQAYKIQRELRRVQKTIPIDPKLLKIRSKVELFKGIDKDRFTAIINVNQKSRILVKDVERFEDIYKRMVTFCQHSFHAKRLVLDAPLCSKAEKALKSLGWEIIKI